MATEEEIGEALRAAAAELTARHYRIEQAGGETDPVTVLLAAIAAGLLASMPPRTSARVLRMLGEMGADGGG